MANGLEKGVCNINLLQSVTLPPNESNCDAITESWRAPWRNPWRNSLVSLLSTTSTLVDSERVPTDGRPSLAQVAAGEPGLDQERSREGSRELQYRNRASSWELQQRNRTQSWELEQGRHPLQAPLARSATDSDSPTSARGERDSKPSTTTTTAPRSIPKEDTSTLELANFPEPSASVSNGTLQPLPIHESEARRQALTIAILMTEFDLTAARVEQITAPYRRAYNVLQWNAVLCPTQQALEAETLDRWARDVEESYGYRAPLRSWLRGLYGTEGLWELGREGGMVAAIRGALELFVSIGKLRLGGGGREELPG